jgi:hypothetical protein
MDRFPATRQDALARVQAKGPELEEVVFRLMQVDGQNLPQKFPIKI